MPNHVRNRIVFDGNKVDIKKAINGLRKIKIDFNLFKRDFVFKKIIFSPKLKINIIYIDFNRIIKMPKKLKITSGPGKYGEYILYKTGDISFLGKKEIMERWGNFSNKRKKEELKLAKKRFENTKLYGYPTWFEWRCSSWGTKWGPWEIKKIGNGIEYTTAWSGTPELLAMYSKKYPNVSINYIFADEDCGRNTGKYIIKNGEIIDFSPKNESSEAFEIYSLLHPDDEYVKKIDGVYQYVCDENE